MSAYTQFMHRAHAAIDERRFAPHPTRPPIFVRTNHLFVEIDEALEKAAQLAEQIKIARVSANVAAAAQLNEQLRVTLWQALEMCKDADKQFKHEVVG